ncbi:MAG: PDZ domain-containing protein [Thermoanaerobaculia bacterium]
MKKTLTALALAAFLAPLAAGEPKAKHYTCQQEAVACLRAMAHKLHNKGWVGLDLDHDAATHTLTVREVIEGSPAEAAGFQPGDVLVAMNGLRYSHENRPALKKAYAALVPGNTVTYTVKREGTEVDLSVVSGQVPERLMAQWIGQHMLEHHVDEAGEEAKKASP